MHSFGQIHLLIPVFKYELKSKEVLVSYCK